MVGGDLSLCSGFNEDSPESSQDPWSLGWCRMRSKRLTLHRLGLVFKVSLLHCPLHAITNILHNTVKKISM